jgi:hypothetical protein
VPEGRILIVFLNWSQTFVFRRREALAVFLVHRLSP